MKTSITVLLFLSLFELNSSLFRKHFYVKENMIWSDAREYCKEHHDDLSTFSNDDIQVLSTNPDIQGDYYWIGLQRDDTNENLWWWSEGGEAVIDRWGSGEPNTFDGKCGGVFKVDSTFFDYHCSWEITFYCMEVYDLTLVQQKLTWEEAIDYCRQHYTDLASLYTDDLMEQGMTLNTAAQTDDVWIGLRFLAGHWFWVNGEDLQYKAWSVEEDLQCPAKNQQCGAVRIDIKIWKPKNCEERLNFICVD